MPFNLSSWSSTMFLGGVSRTIVPYKPLDRNTIEKDDLPFRHILFCKQSAIAGLTFFIGIIAGFLVANRGTWNTMVCTPSLPLVYSPAYSVLSYEIRRFNGSFGTELTEYQGPPTESLDKKWHDLYRYGLSQIPLNEAERLLDKTIPIPGDDENYIVGLEIFHQLHCLNLLRKSLYPGQYPLEPLWHLEHCVDIIRQGLSCSIDITPVYWQWSGHKIVARMDGAHQCTNFASIQQWAFDHQLRTKFDENLTQV